MKRLLILLMLLPALSFSQARWFELKELKMGGELPDTNGVFLRLIDGKLYFMNWAGSDYKRLRFGDADIRIGYADSLIRSPYIQAGTLFGAPDYPLRVNGSSLFYGDAYMKDGQTFGSYSGNGARLKFIHATGTQILNNKGIAFQVAQNADASALLIDSAFITVSRRVKYGADTLATLAEARAMGSGGSGISAATAATMIHDSVAARSDDYATPTHNHNGTYTTPAAVGDSMAARSDDYISRSTIRTLFSAGLIDSVKTSDTVFVGWVYPAAAIDSIIYSGARSQSLTARLELVDSLYQTAGTTLVDTTTCTAQKRRRAAAVSGGTFTLTAAKILRMVFPTVGVMPKQFNVTVVGH